MNKILSLIVMSFVVAATVSCKWSTGRTQVHEKIIGNRADLSKIMALQSFSYQYGLPAEFTISCVNSNSVASLQVYAKQKMLGRAIIGHNYAGSGPDIRWLDCIKEEYPISPEVVSLALLWGYEQGISYFESGFDVKVELSQKIDSVFVESNSLIIGQHYSVDIYKGTNRAIIVGFLGM